jgi:hypothetical protein
MEKTLLKDQKDALAASGRVERVVGEDLLDRLEAQGLMLSRELSILSSYYH